MVAKKVVEKLKKLVPDLGPVQVGEWDKIDSTPAGPLCGCGKPAAKDQKAVCNDCLKRA